jgi:hypothetical protein
MAMYPYKILVPKLKKEPLKGPLRGLKILKTHPK